MLDLTLTGGPFGDATANYDVRISNGMTVMEFCNQINEDEWGSIDVNDETLANYYYGGKFRIADNNLFKKVWMKRVKSAWANGGYGMMDYYLEVE